MSRATRIANRAAGGVLALMVVFVLFFQLGDREGSSVTGSIGSARNDGRRALALLFDRVDLRVEGWQNVPAALPRGRHVVWMPPASADGKNKRFSSVGMHAPEHYAEFVDRGGTLIVEGESGLTFVRDDLELEALEGLAIDATEDEVGVPRNVQLPDGEIVHVDSRSTFEPLDLDGLAREFALCVDDSGRGDRALVVEVPFGEGRVLIVADTALFENAHVGEHEHALLAVRLAEVAPPGARILMDEYSLGLWQREGPLGVASRPALALFSLHVLFALVVWTWLRAAPRAFPRDPEPLDSFSPVRRARAQARLFERAWHVELLVPAARAAVFDRVASRWKLGARRATPDEGRDAEKRDSEKREAGAIAGPSQSDVRRLAALLERVSGAELGARAVDLLYTRRVVTREDLERLTHDLARFEADVRTIESG